MKTNKHVHIKLFIIFLMIVNVINAQWIQVGNSIEGEITDDRSGSSVCLNADGSIMAIGAPNNDGNGLNSGHVRIYGYNGTDWVQLGNDIDGEAAGDNSGNSISLSSDGTIIAIGAYRNGENGIEAGHVRIYEYNGINWIQIGGDVNGNQSDDWFGYSVSLNSDGTKLAIGACRNNNYTGYVSIYENIGGNWVQVGNNIYGEDSLDHSGWSIDLSSDGNILAIGTIYNSDIDSGSGQTRVYEYNGTNWNQLGNDINGENAHDNSGWSVSLNSDGTVLAVGTVHNNVNGIHAGCVKVFQYVSGVWTQIGDHIYGESANDNSGWSVDLSFDGSILAIGSPRVNGTGNFSGHTGLYQYINGNWVQIGNSIIGESNCDFSGWSVCLSSDGNRVAVGAPLNPDSLGYPGLVKVYSINSNSIEALRNKKVNIYPNPTMGIVTIEAEKIQKIQIADINGKLVKQLEPLCHKLELDLRHYTGGVYFVKIIGNKGIYMSKLIKE